MPDNKKDKLARATLYGGLGTAAVGAGAYGVGKSLNDTEVSNLQDFANLANDNKGDLRHSIIDYSNVGHEAAKVKPFGQSLPNFMKDVRSIPLIQTKETKWHPDAWAHYDEFGKGSLNAYLRLADERSAPNTDAPGWGQEYYRIKDLLDKSNNHPSDVSVQNYLGSKGYDKSQVTVDAFNKLLKQTGVRGNADNPQGYRPQAQVPHYGARMRVYADEYAKSLGFANAAAIPEAQQKQVLSGLDSFVKHTNPQFWRQKQFEDWGVGGESTGAAAQYNKIMINPYLKARNFGLHYGPEIAAGGLAAALAGYLYHRHLKKKQLQPVQPQIQQKVAELKLPEVTHNGNLTSPVEHAHQLLGRLTEKTRNRVMPWQAGRKIDGGSDGSLHSNPVKPAAQEFPGLEKTAADPSTGGLDFNNPLTAGAVGAGVGGLAGGLLDHKHRGRGAITGALAGGALGMGGSMAAGAINKPTPTPGQPNTPQTTPTAPNPDQPINKPTPTPGQPNTPQTTPTAPNPDQPVYADTSGPPSDPPSYKPNLPERTMVAGAHLFNDVEGDKGKLIWKGVEYGFKGARAVTKPITAPLEKAVGDVAAPVIRTGSNIVRGGIGAARNVGDRFGVPFLQRPAPVSRFSGTESWLGSAPEVSKGLTAGSDALSAEKAVSPLAESSSLLKGLGRFGTNATGVATAANMALDVGDVAHSGERALAQSYDQDPTKADAFINSNRLSQMYQILRQGAAANSRDYSVANRSWYKPEDSVVQNALHYGGQSLDNMGHVLQNYDNLARTTTGTAHTILDDINQGANQRVREGQTSDYFSHMPKQTPPTSYTGPKQMSLVRADNGAYSYRDANGQLYALNDPVSQNYRRFVLGLN